MIIYRLPTYKCPDIVWETPEVFLHLYKFLSIIYCSEDFESVFYNPRIIEEFFYFLLAVFRDFMIIEVIKSLSKAFSFHEDCVPAKPRLEALKGEKLEEGFIIINGFAPFVVVIVSVEMVFLAPLAAYFLFQSLIYFVSISAESFMASRAAECWLLTRSKTASSLSTPQGKSWGKSPSS